MNIDSDNFNGSRISTNPTRRNFPMMEVISVLATASAGFALGWILCALHCDNQRAFQKGLDLGKTLGHQQAIDAIDALNK